MKCGTDFVGWVLFWTFVATASGFVIANIYHSRVRPSEDIAELIEARGR